MLADGRVTGSPNFPGKASKRAESLVGAVPSQRLGLPDFLQAKPNRQLQEADLMFTPD